jgi:hypothetical protein
VQEKIPPKSELETTKRRAFSKRKELSLYPKLPKLLFQQEKKY